MQVMDGHDADRLVKPCSDPRLRSVPFNPADLAAEDSPAQRFHAARPAVGRVGRRATFDTIPRFLGQLMFFGKQTTARPRLNWSASWPRN
jgi:hypothetical protein